MKPLGDCLFRERLNPRYSARPDGAFHQWRRAAPRSLDRFPAGSSYCLPLLIGFDAVERIQNPSLGPSDPDPGYA